LRVSADTKTCGSPLYLGPLGGLCLPIGKHSGILTNFQTKVNKKMTKNCQNFAHPTCLFKGRRGDIVDEGWLKSMNELEWRRKIGDSASF